MNDEEEAKKPEFIYLSEEEQEQHDAEYSEQLERERIFKKFQKMKSSSYPFFLRIITFFGSISLFFFSLIPLFLGAIALALSLVTFFQVETINQMLRRYWKGFKRMLIIGIGLMLATFIPALGFSLILSYQIMEGEKWAGNSMTAFVMSRYDQKTKK